MLPPPISDPFKTTSYWVVRIPPMFFLARRSDMCSGFGAEKGLWVNVHPEVAAEGSSFSKNGKSTTQQKARRSLFPLSFLWSGLSVPYFAMDSLYVILGNGISWIFFPG